MYRLAVIPEHAALTTLATKLLYLELRFDLPLLLWRAELFGFFVVELAIGKYVVGVVPRITNATIRTCLVDRTQV